MPVVDPVPRDAALPRSVETFAAGQLVVSTGENVLDAEHRVVEPFRRGLTVAVTLHGGLVCRIDDRDPVEVRSPSVALILSGGAHRREQVFAARQRLRYALVHLSPQLVETHVGLSFGGLLEAGRQRSGVDDPIFLTQPADGAIRAAAYQLVVCPIRGVARSLFLTGKALELVALAVEQCLPDGVAPAQTARLTADTVERLAAVRMAILDRIADPPPIARLAASVGLNSRALAQGFAAMFGASIGEFVQEHRLQIAYRMIANGEGTLAEIAYEVGYTPAYFSTLFRKRYGLSPRQLSDS